MRLGVPGADAAPPAGLAYKDVPTIAGPVRPRAVTAGSDRLFVLDGASLESASTSSARRIDPQGLYNGAQTWTFDGRLVGQWAQAGQGVWTLGQLNNFGGAPEDLAAVGARLYSMTPGGIWMRTGVTDAHWVSGVPGVRFIALDADESAVAAFDAVGSRVVVLDAEGKPTHDWPLAADGRAVAASDLAVGGGRVYIADTGRNRVLVRSLAGDDLGEWRTHDGPQRIDRTDDGDIVVLGRGGWGLRYSPDGALRAAWRMPGAFGAKRAQGTDITAGPDGAVYVTYSRVTIGSAEDRSQDVIEAAGIWRFEMSVPPPDAAPPSPDARHCLVDVGKVASPTRVPLGAPVTIALTVQGECPKDALPAQLLCVVDTSWSMNDGFRYRDTPPGALERARRVLVPLLGALDPSVVDVGLVTFGDGAALQTVLSDDIADLRSRILRAQADGDTRMGAGVDLAHAELNGPRRAAGARRAIVIVSDGVFKDDPRAAVAAARADGIDVHALIVTTPEFLRPASARRSRRCSDPIARHRPVARPGDVIIDAIGAWRTEPNVFEALTVRDVVPANMRYVLGSAVPAAAWDASTRTLTWTLPPRPAGARVTLTYAVVPEAAGTWPTNVEADATWRDVRGGGGQLRFPVPHVDVVDRRRIFLPYTMRAVCASWTRPIDLVLVQDVSSSMSEARRRRPANEARGGRRSGRRLPRPPELVPRPRRRRRVRRRRPRRRAAVERLRGGSVGPRVAQARPRNADRPGAGIVRRGARRGPGALALPVVVLLSDGLQNGSADPVRAVLPSCGRSGRASSSSATGRRWTRRCCARSPRTRRTIGTRRRSRICGRCTTGSGGRCSARRVRRAGCGAAPALARSARAATLLGRRAGSARWARRGGPPDRDAGRRRNHVPVPDRLRRERVPAVDDERRAAAPGRTGAAGRAAGAAAGPRRPVAADRPGAADPRPGRAGQRRRRLHHGRLVVRLARAVGRLPDAGRAAAGRVRRRAGDRAGVAAGQPAARRAPA
ncbi:MAG: VWA domain-containing protein [Anaerolineae bacterium]